MLALPLEPAIVCKADRQCKDQAVVYPEDPRRFYVGNKKEPALSPTLVHSSDNTIKVCPLSLNFFWMGERCFLSPPRSKWGEVFFGMAPVLLLLILT